MTLPAMDHPPAPEPEAAVVPAEPAARGSVSILLWMFLMLFILYPLSTGPAFRLTRNNPSSRPILAAAYAPLGFLCDHCPPAGRFFDWYVSEVWGTK